MCSTSIVYSCRIRLMEAHSVFSLGYWLVVEKDFLHVTLVCDDSWMEVHSVEHRLYCCEPIGELVKTFFFLISHPPPTLAGGGNFCFILLCNYINLINILVHKFKFNKFIISIHILPLLVKAHIWVLAENITAQVTFYCLFLVGLETLLWDVFQLDRNFRVVGTNKWIRAIHTPGGGTRSTVIFNPFREIKIKWTLFTFLTLVRDCY